MYNIYGKIKNVPNHQPVYVQTQAGTSFKVFDNLLIQ
jgi:hypothetical protein